MAAISMVKNPIFHQRTRNINKKYNLIGKALQEDVINMRFCRSEEQLTNIFIEALSKDIFKSAEIETWKKKGVSDLKNHHGDLINNASSLAAEREALKQRLDEIAEEEIQIREDAEDLRTQLISRKAELETYMKALPEALRQQNEAENRANNSNDQWGEIRSLFA